MAYSTRVSSLSDRIAQQARASTQASTQQSLTNMHAQSAAQFGNQRINQGAMDKAPGGTIEGRIQDDLYKSPAQVAMNPVAGAQELSRGADAGSRAMSFNQRLTDLARQKAQKDAAARASAAGNGGGGNVAATAGNANFKHTGPVGSGRQGVVNLASTYLGSRYVLGGNNYSGIDCSGLVQQVYRQFGFNLPRLAHQQSAVAGIRTSISNLRPGDLVGWNDGSHIAIYAGNGMIIQAANPSQGVIRSHLSAQTNQGYFGVALRFPGE